MPAGPASRVSPGRLRPPARSGEPCRPKACWRTRWCRSMPTISPTTACPGNWPARASICTVRRWRAGSARRRSTCVRSSIAWPRSRSGRASSGPTRPRFGFSSRAGRRRAIPPGRPRGASGTAERGAVRHRLGDRVPRPGRLGEHRGGLHEIARPSLVACDMGQREHPVAADRDASDGTSRCLRNARGEGSSLRLSSRRATAGCPSPGPA